ncbi:MAG: mechanosensitive ion channel family protein [Desulfatiglans sp.]|jgi:MscS family membrane protein|nr:mechanosensitive ion channel family protein [Thermodesulfobacteriota bacterium]MEE4353295.1 mechanosensitive ion channel family protein [Desulfatiglans sp.]
MESLRQFWSVVIEVWEEGLFGIDIGRIIVAVFIFVGFLLIRRLIARLVINRLNAITKRTKSRLDDDALEVLEKPVSFVPVILGVFFAAKYLPLTSQMELIADRIVRSLIVLVIFWSLIRLVIPLSTLFRELEKILTTTIVDWLIKTIKVAFVFIAAATILEIWGIKIGPILAGMGLLGVAVALGAQDLFKNLISGILIIAERRFNPGDWIRVEDVVEGTVESIGLRSTLVRRFDKAPVHVPNAKLSDNSVINFSSMTHRRIFWIINVEYRTTVEQLRRIRDRIEQYIMHSEEFTKPPEVPMFVRIDRFSDSSIDIMVYCFTKTTIWGEWLEIKERLAYEIKEIVEGEGTAFAFPSQSVYVEEVPLDQAEVFVPPST